MEKLNVAPPTELLELLDKLREEVIEEIELHEKLSRRARHLLDKTRVIRQMVKEYKDAYEKGHDVPFESTALYRELNSYLNEIQEELKNVEELASSNSMLDAIDEIKRGVEALLKKEHSKDFRRFKP